MEKRRLPLEHFIARTHYHQQKFLHDWDKNQNIRKACAVWHRRARKTTMLLNLMIREAYRTKNQTYAYIMPTQRQAKAILWRDAKMIKEHLPDWALLNSFNSSEMVAEFKSGSVLMIGGAGTVDELDRWRGGGQKGFVLDEFATMRYGKELVEEILEPITRANKGWQIYSYTPKGRNHGYEYAQKAEASEDWMYSFLPVTESGLIPDDEIVKIQEDMPDLLFKQEFMCQFLASGGGIIQRVRECICGFMEEPKERHRYVIGVDLGKKVDYTVITVMDQDGRNVVFWDRFNKIGWGFQKERIAQVAKTYNNALVVLDSTGLGDPIKDDLEKMGISVRPYQFTGPSKKALVEKLIVAIEGRHITYPEIDELVAELEEFDIDDKGRYNAPVGLHDDCVMSLALAVEGLGAGIYTQEWDDDDVYVPFNERFNVD